ncbi:hypothetical protein N7493_002561 [Penicillium malachiteum]|uniref:Uncharacterized protein n=1 Tax=Penicillium malachiteum TaxID=1324776 RepID=A0AAD6HSF8_9EURO|nr:hypothetical protein N7493_002561 [Penicillium malachiteum]
MTPDLTTEAKFWPGGVPPFIKSPTENFTVKAWEFTPIVKGWYRFVRENWDSTDEATDESKAQQRRALIETWVTAEQHFRDSYTNKASDSEARFSREEISNYGGYYNRNVPPWNLYLTADAPRPSTNWGLWLKILLMFNDYNRMWGHVAEETFTFTPKENESVTIHNINRYQSLETADFGILAFNNAGEALYDPYQPQTILVDDFALTTGLVLVVLSYTNGRPRQGYRMRALNFFSIWKLIVGLGKHFEDYIERYGHDVDLNDDRNSSCVGLELEVLDMTKPLLEILLAESEEQDVEDEEVEEALTELVPGYMEAEAAGDGLAKDFDLFGSGFEID